MYVLTLIFVILFAVFICVHAVRNSLNQWFAEFFQNTEYISPVLKRHFRKTKADDLYIVSRTFQKMMQIELYREIQKFFEGKKIVRTSAVETNYSVNRLNEFLTQNHREFLPLKYNEVDIGEEKPIRCLNNVFYLWYEGSIPMALLLIQEGCPQILHVDIAVPKKHRAGTEIEQIMKSLEESCKNCESYKHKILSFEAAKTDFEPTETEIKVHHLRQVSRDELILPEKTIDLLERNLMNFVARRQQLKEHGLPTKKGLLFFGPPGTGKTHTLHYIIGQLKKEYTTFLVTADQVENLGLYCQIARLLEPAIIVLEDVDLIARERGQGSEIMLNKLLNEMDGLKGEADVIFLLTTNRPDDLEEAIRNRPGRIDQAIEFPRPDKSSRIKLAHLYSSGFELHPADAEAVAARTEGASAAFIKELLRRSAQFLLERDETATKFETADWENALKEMLTGSTFGVLKLEEERKFML